MSDQLDQVWDQLSFDAKWLSAVERVEAESAVERFLAWQEARTDQELLGTEVGFRCEVGVGAERVRLTGTADRVERDPDGRIRIVDFKTSKTEPRAADVAVQDQLGCTSSPSRPERSPRWPGRTPVPVGPSWSICGCRTRRHAAEGLPAGLAGRRAVPARRPRTRRAGVA